jgi:uncharacterized membrane protein HdeD (DUF308 family)
MTGSTTDEADRQSFFARSVQDHWVLFLVEGVLLIVLGMIAIAIPPLATLAVTILLGWVFLISGIVGLITSIMARHAPGFWWSILSAIVGILAGLVLLAWPVSGSVSLTLVLIAFFLIEGVVTIMYAIEHRRALSGRWGWLVASGILDLVLAGIVIAGLPGTALWAPGLLVGINMVFGGWALVAMGLHARKARAQRT